MKIMYSREMRMCKVDKYMDNSLVSYFSLLKVTILDSMDSGLIRMDSYFFLAVYMIYYLSVNLWSIEYFVCLQKKNARRR